MIRLYLFIIFLFFNTSTHEADYTFCNDFIFSDYITFLFFIMAFIVYKHYTQMTSHLLIYRRLFKGFFDNILAQSKYISSIDKLYTIRPARLQIFKRATPKVRDHKYAYCSLFARTVHIHYII